MKIHALCIDLGKTVFHLVGLDSSGQVVVRKRCSRTRLLTYNANLQVQVVGMEACSGEHFLGRALREQGHEVRLMPTQFLKPYVQTNKRDFLDAEAIAEAVQRPRMRIVPIKTEEQLDLQALHRVRERWVMRRMAVVMPPSPSQVEIEVVVQGKTEMLREAAPNGFPRRPIPILADYMRHGFEAWRARLEPKELPPHIRSSQLRCVGGP